MARSKVQMFPENPVRKGKGGRERDAGRGRITGWAGWVALRSKNRNRANEQRHGHDRARAAPMIQPSTHTAHRTALHQLSDQAPAQRIRRRYTVTQVVVMVLVMGVGGRGRVPDASQRKASVPPNHPPVAIEIAAAHLITPTLQGR